MIDKSFSAHFSAPKRSVNKIFNDLIQIMHLSTMLTKTVSTEEENEQFERSNTVGNTLKTTLKR